MGTYYWIPWIRIRIRVETFAYTKHSMGPELGFTLELCQYYGKNMLLQQQSDYAEHFFLSRLGCTLARNSLSNSHNSSSSSSCIRQLCSSPSSSSTAGSRSSRRRTGWSPSGRRYSGGSPSNPPGENSLFYKNVMHFVLFITF
jgi:hypothetical protein